MKLSSKQVAAGAALLGLVAAAYPVAAHHSTTMFDREKFIVLEGTVKELHWTNPHVAIFIENAVAKPGVPDGLWVVELTSPGQSGALGMDAHADQTRRKGCGRSAPVARRLQRWRLAQDHGRLDGANVQLQYSRPGTAESRGRNLQVTRVAPATKKAPRGAFLLDQRGAGVKHPPPLRDSTGLCSCA